MRFDAFKIPVSEKGVPVVTKDMENQERESRLQLTSIATNDVATSEIQQDMLSAENQGRQLVSEHVTSWFIEENVPFLIHLRRTTARLLIQCTKQQFQESKMSKK